jgi:ATP-dependent Clp protease ATP-binding subunit ClpA
MNPGFGRFDKKAQETLALAQGEATRLAHRHIGTEHLLLGMLNCKGCSALAILRDLGVDAEQLRSGVEAQIQREDVAVSGKTGLTLRAKQVLELAAQESQEQGHRTVGTEHILVGMLRLGQGRAFAALAGQGITREAVLAGIAGMHGSGGDAGETPDMENAPERPANERFDKFTERARRVLTYAQEEATRFNHNYIGTEHLLLGLVREGEGVAARVLSNLGVGLDRVRSEVEFIIGRGDRPAVGEVGLTPRSKRVIELAVDEARHLGHHYIGTEHLLLGLVREGEGIASGVLASLHVDLEKVRAQAIQVLAESGRSVRVAEAQLAATGEGMPAAGPRPIEYLMVRVGHREGEPVILQVDARDDLRFTPGEVPLPVALRLFGAEGWNLAAIDRPPATGGQEFVLYIFSRSA